MVELNVSYINYTQVSRVNLIALLEFDVINLFKLF